MTDDDQPGIWSRLPPHQKVGFSAIHLSILTGAVFIVVGPGLIGVAFLVLAVVIYAVLVAWGRREGRRRRGRGESS
ncbi:MAG TPA: hypothetical protein VGL69_06365 [Solirubrobacteraceae bacterium]|jgi:Flp pilus assembly protein TadB